MQELNLTVEIARRPQIRVEDRVERGAEELAHAGLPTLREQGGEHGRVAARVRGARGARQRHLGQGKHAEQRSQSLTLGGQELAAVLQPAIRQRERRVQEAQLQSLVKAFGESTHLCKFNESCIVLCNAYHYGNTTLALRSAQWCSVNEQVM